MDRTYLALTRGRTIKIKAPNSYTAEKKIWPPFSLMPENPSRWQWC